MMAPLVRSWLLGVLFLIFHLKVSFASTDKTIIVSPSGKDIPSCGTSANPCKTLDLALQTAKDQGMNFTRILLKQGKYELKKTFVFTYAENVSLVGETTQVSIQCSFNVTLTFLLSQNIELHNLKIKGCGGWQKSLVGSRSPSGAFDYMEYITGLYFSYVRNLHVRNVEVSASYGVGITLNDVAGTIRITKSAFIDNLPRARQNNQTGKPQENKKAHTGGGIFLLLNSFGYNPINISRKTHDTYQHNNQYLFTDVVFRGNEAESPASHVTMNTPLVPFSRGGGIGIYLFGNASGNAFAITRCEFVGNKAQWGGGLQAEFKQVTHDNVIRVQQSIFRENYASFAGGGARFGDLTISKQVLQPNKFLFDDCQFLNNTSIWGGGASIYGTTFLGHIESPFNRQKFVLTNCYWKENNGNVGSAIGVFLFNLNDDTIGPYQSVHIVLDNCTVVNNEVITLEEDILIGQGAVYTVEVPIIFKGNVSIVNNTNTGMVLDSAMAVIDGQVLFHANKGYSGGALALYGNSRVRLHKKSKLIFIGNECVDKGGAMYINAPGPPQVSFNATGYSTHQCFFDYIQQFVDYDQWETEIVFQDNRAPNEESGLSVYATTLQNCRRVGEKRKNNTVLQWRIVTFLDGSGQNRTSVNREVSTDPLDIKFEKDDWIVGASEPFNATLALLDEKGNPVVGMVDVSTSAEDGSSGNVRLSTPSSLFLVNKTIQRLSFAGKGGDRFNVALRSIGAHQLQKAVRNLTLKSCNPGFHNEGDECVCSNTFLRGIARCGEDRRTVYLKRGYWAGTVDGKFQTAICPVNYCSCPDPFGSNLIGECTYIPGQMCSGNRDSSSVLCGRCKLGYTAAFESDECVEECSRFKGFYFVLIMLCLLLLVLVSMMIEVDVFTGYLNAWLYSYQVITLITPGTFTFDGFMTFVIGVANLELRVKDFCLVNGIDDADEMIINLSIPFFTLILVLVVFLVGTKTKCCPDWYTSKVKSPYSALCVFFVLCYTNITSVSLKILTPVTVGDGKRLFAQGELRFLRGKHVFYSICALVFIIFVVMVPLFLILQSFTSVINNCAPILRPLFNKLQGCFKDKYRWCSAFYFVSRLLILVLDTYITRTPLKRAILEGACVFVLTFFVYLRPYRKKKEEENNDVEKKEKQKKDGEIDYDWINISDAILLSNLTVIAIFSSVYEESPSKSVRKGVGVFINVLAYLPLLVLLFVLYKAIRGYFERRKAKGKKPILSALQNISPCVRKCAQAQDKEETQQDDEISGGTELA